MNGSKCILQLRGVRPFLSDKFDITKHKRYKELSDFDKKNAFDIHAEGPAFFSWLPKMFGKRVVVTIHGIDWQREKWQSGLGSKFIHQGEKNAVKYADEVIVLSKGFHHGSDAELAQRCLLPGYFRQNQEPGR